MALIAFTSFLSRPFRANTASPPRPKASTVGSTPSPATWRTFDITSHEKGVGDTVALIRLHLVLEASPEDVLRLLDTATRAAAGPRVVDPLKGPFNDPSAPADAWIIRSKARLDDILVALNLALAAWGGAGARYPSKTFGDGAYTRRPGDMCRRCGRWRVRSAGEKPNK